MRWSNRSGMITGPPSSAGGPSKSLAHRRPVTRLFSLLLLLCAFFVSFAASEKHLAVFSVAANYSLPLVQREGRDYVGLLELLEPLGRVSAKSDASRWRLRYNNVEGQFLVGKTRAQVLGRDTDLGGRFLMENRRGLVPVASLGAL